jgi:ABC-2 type transport system ATP-binding protein
MLDRSASPTQHATPDAGGGVESAISARGLTKVYTSKRGKTEKLALDSIDLDVPHGSFFGLLGPNGAGKSTFINILGGMTKKTAGTVSVLGRDIDSDSRRTRASLGIVPQELNMDAHFTPFEALEFQAGFYGVPKNRRQTDAILAALGLTEQRDWYARRLSGGMQRRLLVGKALVHNPPVLILDEPTAGVDVEIRHQLWNHIRGLNQRGTTVVLTTHYLEEAEQLCDRIAIINHGQVVACDETQTLIRQIDKKALTVTLVDDIESIPESLTRFDAELGEFRQLRVSYRRSQTQISEILGAVQAAGLEIADLTTQESNLEDLFLQLTRRTRE